LAGAVLGFIGAQWGTGALISAIPSSQLSAMPYLMSVRPNGVVFAFLAGVSVLTGILFGLAPALQASNEQAGGALKEEGRTSSGSRSRMREALVIAEVAISLVLLVGAGLMIKSLASLLHRDPGFDARNLFTFSVNLPQASYPKDADAIRFDKQFRAKLEAMP